jgi:hypothetical protein
MASHPSTNPAPVNTCCTGFRVWDLTCIPVQVVRLVPAVFHDMRQGGAKGEVGGGGEGDCFCMRNKSLRLDEFSPF